jgi:DNA polymerase IV (DinB-like DNA polymerase)
MDSFYASAEMARRPELRNLPLIIGPDPKEWKGRGVVLTCNYLARKYGVRSAMPIAEAARRCPQAVYLHPDFKHYESLSAEVMKLLGSYSERFEQVSIDEAFLDVTREANNVGETRELALRIKADLKEKTGLTCSIGIAENKSTAKIASDTQKPDGLVTVEPGKAREFLAPLSIRAISSVGEKTASILNQAGIEKIADLQKLPVTDLRRVLGETGVWIWRVATANENEIVQEHAVKSMSTESTFDEDVDDWETVKRTTDELATELARRVNDSGLCYKKVTIKIRFTGFETHTREASLPSYSTGELAIRREAALLLETFRQSKKKVRLLGVKVSDLKSTKDQATITAWTEQEEAS